MQSELSKIVPISQIREPIAVSIVATSQHCAALARRFGILDIRNLQASLDVTPELDNLEYTVRGMLTATVVQECVVTFEPVVSQIEQGFERIFAANLVASLEVDVDPLGDEPEPIEGGELDLGELVAEELSLALDPYPRRDEADAVLAPYERVSEDGDDEDKRDNPFAALKDHRAVAGQR